MAVLTAAKRKKLKKERPEVFGLPKKDAYPMPDREHAGNAKARATQMVKKHKLSKSSEEKIDAKANKILGKKKAKILLALASIFSSEDFESLCFFTI